MSGESIDDPETSAEDPLRLLEAAGPRTRLAADRAARVQENARQAWLAANRHRRERQRFRRFALPVAAAAAVLLGVVAYFADFGRLGPASPSASSQGTNTVAPAAPAPLAVIARLSGDLRVDGQAATLGQKLGVGSRLTSDGTTALALAGGASLRLSAATLTLAGPRRVELERGRVYLDTGPQALPGEGFTIATPFAEVRDIGTQFEVGVDHEELTVRVREGEIEVRRGRAGSGQTGPGSDASGVPAATARAGQSLRLHADHIELAASPTSGPSWRWTEEVAPAPAIEGRPLAELLAWVAREQGRSWAYEDPALEAATHDIVLHGSIEGLVPEDALALVLPGCNLEFHRAGEVFSLRRRAPE